MAETPAFSLTPDLTLDAAQARMAAALAEAGLEAAQREARLTVMAALGLSAAQLLLTGNRALGPDCARLVQVARRRMAREPLARIIGRKEFYGLEFALSDATLVPRPDTETLVEAVLEAACARGFDRRAVMIADLGTGSGAILTALLHALPQANGLGVDLAPEALETAEANLLRHCGPGRARFQCGDWLDGIDQRFDIIVSNPPYIETGDLAGLDPEVRGHDPVLALDGGADGLEAYCRIIAETPLRLTGDGVLALELGAGQEAAVRALCHEAGLMILGCRADLAGIPRALVAAKRA